MKQTGGSTEDKWALPQQLNLLVAKIKYYADENSLDPAKLAEADQNIALLRAAAQRIVDLELQLEDKHDPETM